MRDVAKIRMTPRRQSATVCRVLWFYPGEISMLRFTAAVLSMSIAAYALAASSTENAMYEMSAVGEVQIAPDGSVSDYRLQSTLSPAIAKLVDGAVRSWHFDPIVVDGKAVVAKTALRLSLKAEPIDAGNY